MTRDKTTFLLDECLNTRTIAICQLEIDRRYEIFLSKLDTTIPCECMNTSGSMTGKTIV